MKAEQPQTVDCGRAVADKLREARALIAKGWTQGSYARTVGGRPIGFEEANATCWCSLGALFRVVAGGELRTAHDTLVGVVGNRNLVAWNDTPHRTQAEVLAAFDKAIEIVERPK